MKATEDRLSEHINTVFGATGQIWKDLDLGDPERGWLELRKKYPEKKNHRTLYLWLSGVAACLLMVTAGLWLNRPSLPEGQSALLRPPKRSTIPLQAPASVIISKPVVTQRSSVSPARKARPMAITEAATIVTVQDSTVAVADIQRADTTGLPVSQTVIAQTPKREADKYSFLREETRRLQREEKSAVASTGKPARQSTSKALFDVYTATFLNYYGDNPSSVNAGAGFNANIRISKHMYLAVGAGISENNISYSNNSRPSSLSGDLANVVLGNGDIVPITGSKLEASFLNIDLPVAIKFYPGKSGRYYLSTGINSSTYLNQKYLSSLNYYNQSASGFSSVPNKREELGFNGFDFAGSAIFAVGINQRLGKGSVLSFEPFFKPALQGIGEKNFKINTVGLGLKLGFGRKNTGN